ncbi:MAG: hypothetical protein KatS3mg013_0515 [Actinomycetota bacterium]|nr:MAG: hypothetical protein KatS3mg013_0515 [Actinomycetota bacterium]
MSRRSGPRGTTRRLASIRPDVTSPIRPRLALLAVLAFLAVACTALPQAEVRYGTGVTFVPMVADAIDDVGLGVDVAVDAQGQPFTTYFGLPAPEGAIAVTRPVNTAFLPAVQLTTVADGIFVRGAVAQVQDPPAPQYVVPFGPQTVPSLEGLTRESAGATAIAIAGDGTKHVAWTGNDGVWYASGTDRFTAEPVEAPGRPIRQAGPIGPPSIVVGPDGDPWIAYQVVTPRGVEVRAASRSGERWDVEVVARLPLCPGCPPPGPAPIAVVDQTPTVVFADPASDAIGVARLEGSTWAVDGAVVSATDALGLSVAAHESDAWAAYYAEGAVWVAPLAGGSPIEGPVVELGAAATSTGALAPRTDLATDGEGNVVVAWQDVEGVHLAAVGRSGLEPIETIGTESGVTPAVAVAPDGSTVYLAWYEPGSGDLFLGMRGKAEGVALAVPSPIPPPTAAGPVAGPCGEDGKPILEIVSSGTTFTSSCLVAPADEPFTITYENPEPILHNIAVYVEQGGDLIAGTEPQTGPVTQELDVPALEAGEYFFQCDVHPTTMLGTLAVVGKGGGGKGGGGS